MFTYGSSVHLSAQKHEILEHEYDSGPDQFQHNCTTSALGSQKHLLQNTHASHPERENYTEAE